MRSVSFFFQVLLGSLFQRWRYGDGMLLFAPILFVLFQQGFSLGLSEGSRFLLLLLALGQGYLFNDLMDCEKDRENPKKDPRFVQFLIAQRRRVWFAHIIVLLLLGMAGFALELRAGVFYSLFILVGILYSLFFKQLPILDLLWVGLWGSAYLGIVSGDRYYLGLMGLMTAISHLYQTEMDRRVDLSSRIRTTSALPRSLRLLFLLSLCLALAFSLHSTLPGFLLVLPFLPLLFYLRFPPLPGWLLSKGVLGVLWVVVLAVRHGYL